MKNKILILLTKCIKITVKMQIKNGNKFIIEKPLFKATNAFMSYTLSDFASITNGARDRLPTTLPSSITSAKISDNPDEDLNVICFLLISIFHLQAIRGRNMLYISSRKQILCKFPHINKQVTPAPYTHHILFYRSTTSH